MAQDTYDQDQDQNNKTKTSFCWSETGLVISYHIAGPWSLAHWHWCKTRHMDVKRVVAARYAMHSLSAACRRAGSFRPSVMYSVETSKVFNFFTIRWPRHSSFSVLNLTLCQYSDGANGDVECRRGAEFVDDGIETTMTCLWQEASSLRRRQQNSGVIGKYEDART